MGMITLKVSDELHKLVRIKVVEEDTTIKDYVTDLILKDLQKKKSNHTDQSDWLLKVKSRKDLV